MKLLVKDDCENCEWIKQRIPEGADIELIDGTSPDGIALLAFHEKLEDTKFPILITDDDKVIEGTIRIKNDILAKDTHTKVSGLI